MSIIVCFSASATYARSALIAIDESENARYRQHLDRECLARTTHAANFFNRQHQGVDRQPERT
jgi:hypothetical protein